MACLVVIEYMKQVVPVWFHLPAVAREGRREIGSQDPGNYRPHGLQRQVETTQINSDQVRRAVVVDDPEGRLEAELQRCESFTGTLVDQWKQGVEKQTSRIAGQKYSTRQVPFTVCHWPA